MNDPQIQPIEPSERPGEAAGEARKSYCKPSFCCEQVFETMALQCGKTGPINFSCKQTPNAS